MTTGVAVFDAHAVGLVCTSVRASLTGHEAAQDTRGAE